VWKGAAEPSYLMPRVEDDCRNASRWTSEIAAAGLVRALRAAGMRGQEIRNLWVRSRTPTGRAARIAASGFDPQEIDGETFRMAVGRTLGWQMLKSTDFNVTRTAAGYRFDGRGAGHGVGLCVMGAARLARGGSTAEAILAAYFPGTSLGSVVVPEPRVEVTVPAGAEREREVAVELVKRWLKEYATRLSVPGPPFVSLVFHPSVESYLRATGQPWWTAAATQGPKVNLLPPSVLRQRGSFEQTLRHEIAHLVIADRLRDRPLWVREAAAMYVSNEIPLSKAGAVQQAAGATAGRRACPSDEEMRGLASAEAMREAYSRAAACYAEQLAAGKKWDEIR
jgi:stage II sporulation protein D